MLKHMQTRRAFLQNGMAILAASATVPAFLDQTVLALDRAADGKRTQSPTGTDGKVLVVVQLAGGNDGLSTIIPYADDAYQRARGSIARGGKSVLKLNDYVGLHPALAPLKGLYDDGHLGIVQGVGYPNPNRSHFRATDIWSTAQPEQAAAATGWVGRYFDNACPGADPHVGMAIGNSLPLAMQGTHIMPLSIERPEAYRYQGRDRDDYEKLNRATGHAAAGAGVVVPNTMAESAKYRKKVEVTPASQLDFLERTALDAQVSSDEILRLAGKHAPAANYPQGELGQRLQTVAAMIAGNLPTRVYYVSMGGFDTHAQQAPRHDRLMDQLGKSLAAFWHDLKRTGAQDRVCVMTFSEFGRRVSVNASGGTDHGAAAPMFLMGPNIRPGLLGRHPSLTDLDGGDLKYNTDFRSVYATILQNWLETPSKPILGQQFPTLPVLKA